MAKSDVRLNVTGLTGVTPIGVTINYSFNAIPTCSIDLSPQPGSGLKITGASGVLSNIDAQKRQSTVTVSASVTSTSGTGGAKNKSIQFRGLLDGLSIGNTVGGNSYQAIIKNEAQTLLEVTTMTPGLYPTSVDIYRNPFYSVSGSSQKNDDQSSTVWVSKEFSSRLDFSSNCIQFYTDLMKLICHIQKDNFELYLGNSVAVDSTIVLRKIFTDKAYQVSLQKAIDILNRIDLSAVTSGAIGQFKTSYPNISDTLKQFYSSGPNILLENYMNFLKFMGCGLVIGNSKIYVVPENSFIKQTHTTPGLRQSATSPNVCYPADYNSYIYNDNGYRDIKHVIVNSPVPVGGMQIGKAIDVALIGSYSDTQVSKAAGVLVVSKHPFMLLSCFNDNSYPDAKDLKQTLDSAPKYYYQNKQFFGTNETAENQSKRVQEKTGRYIDFLKDIINNYAEIKFYQARYSDRGGSVTMEFDPKWVPGTSGTLYIRETKLFLDFFVTSVTHHISLQAPASGSAVTTVSFSCGRLGSSPSGISSDQFLGYNKSKEDAVKAGFLADINAN